MIHFLAWTSSKDFHGPFFTQRPCSYQWFALLPQAVMELEDHVDAYAVLLHRAMFGVMVLLQPGAVLTS